jgi:two-component system sensor histidine kinase/response regulator
MLIRYKKAQIKLKETEGNLIQLKNEKVRLTKDYEKVSENSRINNENKIILNKVTEEITKVKDQATLKKDLSDRFIINLSHEIRTPLNSILGMTELALSTNLSFEQKDYLETVKNSANGLLYVIDDIRDYWKIESRTLKLEPEEFNIRDCLDDVINIVALRAHFKKIEFAYHVSQQIPEIVIGDSKRFKQILLNIYTHLLKFINDDDLVLQVERKDKDSQLLRVTLLDTVLSFQKEKLHTILTPLIQNDLPYPHTYAIAGIGLNVAKNLIKMMDGEIWFDKMDAVKHIDKKYNNLIHFTVKFNQPDQITNRYEKKYLSHVHGSSLLIVEKDQKDINSLLDIFNNLKMEPIVVNDIKEAAQELEKSRQKNKLPTLILLNTNYDGKDFSQFIKEIKRENIPIILITNNSSQKKSIQSKQLFVHSIISKPIKPTELTYEIYNVFAKIDHKTETAKLTREHKDPDHHYNYKILVADDNLVDRKLIVRLMEKLGHQVNAVESGREVISAIKNKKYDLILMDLQMPEMDGIETTHKVRDLEKAKGEHTAIIALTAHAMQEDKERCLASGMDGYVSKPIKIDELLETIDNILYHQTILQ